MTAPSPSNLYNPPGSSIDRTSGSTPPRPQQAAWGPSQQTLSRRGLTPLSTSTTSNSSRPATSQSPRTDRNPWSPSANSVAQTSSASRQASRTASITSTSSPFSPSASSQQQALLGSLLSSRSRNIGPSAGQQAASPAPGLQGSGLNGNSISTSSKNFRASPSLQQSAFGAPAVGSNSALQTPGQSGSLQKIAIAQVFLLLSTMKEDKDGSKANQVRQLVSDNGNEVFVKYFRRLLSTHAPQIFGNGRNVDSAGSYPLLAAEVQKVTQDPIRAVLIAEAVDQGDGEGFRDFDLSTFLEHFKMNSFAKVTLASAFKRSSKADLRTKADAIIYNNLNNFLSTIANPPSSDTEDYTPALLASIVDRLAQDPPRSWNESSEQNLHDALQQRYHNLGMLVPVEVSSALAIFGLLSTANSLVRLVKSYGPKGTETVAAARTMLESAELRDISYQQVASALLFMIIARDDPPYQAGNFIAAVREHHGGQRLDWQDVVHDFDREGIKITKTQFKRLFDALVPLARDYENFDLQLLWGGDWHQEETQLAFVCAFVSHTEDELDASQIPRLRKAFTVDDFQDAPEDIQAYAQKAVRHPLVSVEATKALFNMVFRSSETYLHAQNFGVVDNIINANMDLFVSSVSAVPKPWSALQDQAIKQLVASFFWKAVRGSSFALHLLWKRDSSWLAQRLFQYYQQKPIQLVHILDLALEHNWLNDLIAENNELSLDLAAVAHGRGVFDLETWLDNMAQSIRTDRIVSTLALFLRGRAEDDLNAQRERIEHITVPLTINTVTTILQFLGKVSKEGGLADEERAGLLRVCITAYPRLINYDQGFDAIIDANGRDGNALSPDADARMQEHYKLMYSGEKTVSQVIEDLQKLKVSQDPADQDLFACMVFGLFDEYNCFAEYPLDALAMTAVLFGGIIKYDLLSRFATQVAISMVLDALKTSQPHDSMYKFGLQALIHFQNRLEEWRELTRVLYHIPTLQGTPVYPELQRILREAADGHDNSAAGELEVVNGAADDFLAPESRFNEFTCLSVDPPSRLDFYHNPDSQLEELVLFNLNNVSERNLADKSLDIKTRLQEEHHQWFAQYLVESRIKAQPNYHQLYMSMLDELNDKNLWAEVLRETYVNVIKMLNAEATMNSSNERTHLKNLGAWLGSMTLARNQAIKYRNISFRDLLLEGNDTQRLLVVIPFTCKVLSLAAQSLIFRPPSAWTMEIVHILIELYHFGDLKLNLKFEIEVLCKALDLDYKDLEASDVIRTRPQLEEDLMQPPMPDGLEGFGELSLFAGRRELAGRFSPSAIQPELATLTSALKHNYSLPNDSPGLSQRIHQTLSLAAERAVSDIIGPVVERSVTIAAISASQLLAKDFALEPDPQRYRDAAHAAVRNMAGSLAGVTCKEPLRSSMHNHIQVLRSQELSEQELPQGSVLMFINDNIDTVCNFVEDAAEKESIDEIDRQIEDQVSARRNGNYQPPQISNWAYFIPEPYRPSLHTGLNRDQLAIYQDFGKNIRSVVHESSVSQDSGRQAEMLQDQYSALTGMPTPAEAPTLPQDVQHPSAQATPASMTQQMVNGYSDAQIMSRLSELVRALHQTLLDADHDAPELPLTESRAVNEAHLRLGEALHSAMTIYNDQATRKVGEEIASLLRSENQKFTITEYLVNTLAEFCLRSDDTARTLHGWAYQHLNERPYQSALIVALVRADMLDVNRVDQSLAQDLRVYHDQESVQHFSSLVDGLLLTERPAVLRADFCRSLSQLTNVATSLPDNGDVQALLRKLHDSALMPSPPSSEKVHESLEAQVDYIFEEWVGLQEVEHATASLVFVHQLHSRGLLKDRDGSATFFRACVDSCILSFEQEEMKQNGSLENAYKKTDALAKLIVLVVGEQGKAVDGVMVNKIGLFEHIMTLLALVLAFHYRHKAERFNSKVFFRLFSTILHEIYGSQSLIVHLRELLHAFGRTLLMLAPNTFPGFAFAWVSLHSHRLFMPAMLRSQDDDSGALYTVLLGKQLSHVSELMYAAEIPPAAQEYYRGVLKLMLVLHHDYPEYLAEYHNEILSYMPLHCTQLRSLVVSACPASLHDLPDPFTEGLKVDRLEDMKRSPVIRGDIEAPLIVAGIKAPLDAYLNGSADPELLEQLAADLNNDLGPHGNIVINSFVLYMLRHLEINNRQRSLAFSANSAQARLLDTLADKLSSHARYMLLNSIVNQLRYPNTHTHYFMYAMLHLFRAGQTDQMSLEIQEQITRVFAERIIVHRPHPWGLMVTLIELLKNRTYRFWDLPFVKAAPDLERMFGPLLQQMGAPGRTL